MGFYFKGLSKRILSIRLWLVIILPVLTVSCSDSNDPAAAKCPETSSHVLRIAQGKEIDSMSTVQGVLVAAGKDPNVFIWDWMNLKQPARKIPIEPLAWVEPQDRSDPKYHNLNKTSVLFSPDCVIYASNDSTDTAIVFKGLDAKRQLKRLSVGRLWICDQLRATCNGRFLVAFFEANVVYRVEGVNRRDGKRAYRIGMASTEHMEIKWLPTFFRVDWLLPDISSVAVSEDGKYIAVVGTFNRGWISLVDATTGKVLWEKRPQEKDLLYGKWTVNFNDVCFSDDGELIYVAGNCGLFCFDIADGKILKQWPGLGRVMQVAVSPDGRLVAGGGSGSVFICDAKTSDQVAKPILRLLTDQATTHGFAFSPDSALLATCGVGPKGIKIWKMPTPDSQPQPETQ